MADSRGHVIPRSCARYPVSAAKPCVFKLKTCESPVGVTSYLQISKRITKVSFTWKFNNLDAILKNYVRTEGGGMVRANAYPNV